MPPVFEFTDHFDSSVVILGRPLPIKVKRYPRADADALWQRAQELDPRGSAVRDAEAEAQSQADLLAFFEQVISESITLDEGVVVDKGQSVTTGAGLLALFYNRRDALATLAAAVIIENRMMPSLAKNSNSPRVSDTGSERSIPARGGDGQGPTVASAESSNSAVNAGATDASRRRRRRASASSGVRSEAMAAG